MKQPSFKIYATLLDSYYNYLNSDEVWETYWGNSATPPHTKEEFGKLQFQSIIDRINRVPFDSEAADKGTAFNEVIDCLILNEQSDKIKVERSYPPMDDYEICSQMCRQRNCDYSRNCSQFQTLKEQSKSRHSAWTEPTGLNVTYNNRTFLFPLNICREFQDYYKGAIPQVLTSATLNTKYGEVLLYGYIDELMPTSVHDIKTTGNYDFPKFKDHFQHLVYPYCLIQNGMDISKFEYNILCWKDMQTYTETYLFNPERDIPILTDFVEDFITFLNDNKQLITDKKIFGGEND